MQPSTKINKQKEKVKVSLEELIFGINNLIGGESDKENLSSDDAFEGGSSEEELTLLVE